MALNYEFDNDAYTMYPRKIRTCKYCGRLFTSQEWLQRHRKMKHDKEVKRY